MPLDLRLATDAQREWAAREARKLSALDDPASREDAIKTMLLATRLAAGWRPIDDDTPRHGNYVRVYAEEGALFCPLGGQATHWMPLPEQPMSDTKG